LEVENKNLKVETKVLKNENKSLKSETEVLKNEIKELKKNEKSLEVYYYFCFKLCFVCV
jgi:cell division protein FtsB